MIFLLSDPKHWSEEQVSYWLSWAVREFSLEGLKIEKFNLLGRDIVAMGKDAFLERAPPFMGDILWEHLEILKNGKL